MPLPPLKINTYKEYSSTPISPQARRIIQQHKLENRFVDIDFPKTSQKITSPTIKNAALSILDLRDDAKLTYTPQTFKQESKLEKYK